MGVISRSTIEAICKVKLDTCYCLDSTIDSSFLPGFRKDILGVFWIVQGCVELCT